MQWSYRRSTRLRPAQLWALSSIVSLLIASIPAQAQIFKNLIFKSVTVPGATETEVTGAAIRNDNGKPGDVVGFYVDSRGVDHGFFRGSSGKITTVDVPGSTGTRIYGVELTGMYVVGWYTDSKLVTHGFVRQQPNGKFETLDVPGAAWTQSYSVNLDGTVFGAYSDQGGVVHGFVFNDPFFGKGFTALDFPDSSSTEILGASNYGNGFSGTFMDFSGVEHGFLGSEGHFVAAIDFPGAGLTSVNGLDTGSGNFLVGYYGASAAGPFRGFVTNDGNGRYQSIDFPGATDTRCIGMTDGYRITGRYTDSAGAVHGFFADASL